MIQSLHCNVRFYKKIKALAVVISLLWLSLVEKRLWSEEKYYMTRNNKSISEKFCLLKPKFLTESNIRYK
jgi:hypothetical protein